MGKTSKEFRGEFGSLIDEDDVGWSVVENLYRNYITHVLLIGVEPL